MNRSLGRRQFVGAATGLTLGFAGLRRLAASGTLQSGSGYGELVRDPEGVLDLPRGFRYTPVSPTGEMMDDGFYVPGAHDGMAAFPGPGGTTLLVRNHELTPRDSAVGPFRGEASLASRLDASRTYDPGCPGGTTTLVYDTREQALVRQFLSLTGTIRNCAGGPTPWGSWVTCEESVDRVGGGRQREHGFAFEVPAAGTGPVVPVPLEAMGRFNHEAIAVDAASGAVYETEDRGDGLFYRFLPEEPGRLERGGRLQALCIRGLESADTSNSGEVTIGQGRRYAVDWVDLDDAVSPEDDLRVRGRAKGAATFVRGEGIWSAPGTVFFAATGGGENASGQIWLYRPGELEGTPGEGAEPATLELFAEPNDTGLLDSPDNLTISPWGDVVICEDGPDGNSVRGVTPAGGLYTLARNAMNDSELTGATFSPDGTTLFVNIQRPGLTLAVTGPWV